MLLRALLPSLIFLIIATEASSQTVYLTPEEAIKLIFPGARPVTEKKTLTPEMRSKVEKSLGKKIKKEQWTFYIAKEGGKIVGYALVDNEIGKTEPITFMTALTTQGEVKAVEILVYREAYGGEVHQKPFLKQFYGKRSSDTLRLGKEISNITGATLSARAVTVGVRRALLLWEVSYGKN